MRFIHVAGKGSFWWRVGKRELVVWKGEGGKRTEKKTIVYEDLYEMSHHELERAMYKGYFQVKPSAVRRFIKDVY